VNDPGFDLPPPARLSPTRVAAFAVVVAVVFAIAFVVGWLPRRQARASLESAQAQLASGPRVEVVTPKLGSSDRALTLPGSVQPLQETVVYARANGYVRKWLVDIGDRVQDGQLIAELDTPDLDQQIDQGRAQLAQAQASILQAKANRDFSSLTYERYKTLTNQGLSAPADLDQRKAQAQVDEANVAVAQASANAADANVRHLVQLKAFARVTSPFAGTVTARMIETGALVTSGNATPLFKIATMDPARVGVRAYAGRAFAGAVARSGDELDAASRTMNTEVRVANGDGALMAGMYAEVTMTLPLSHRVIEIPATAVVNDSKGMRVLTVDADDHVHVVPVVVEQDNGATIDVASGLTGTERIVKLGTAELTEGTRVTVAH